MKQLFLYISLVMGLCLHAQNYEVQKCEFNSDYNEYSAGWNKDGVIFSSDKKPEVMVTYLDNDDNYYSELYISEEKEGVAMEKSTLLSKEISTALNEGSVSFSPDGRTMYYTSNIQKENQKIRPGFEFKLGIFEAHKKEGVWHRTGYFTYNSLKQDFNTGHPAISPDGSFMIFASDREGGNGGSDLWISHFSNEEWQKPEVLPSSVNTKGAELFPFIDESNVLYFSSNGHGDSTDLDIYKVKIESLESGVISKMPAPINTEYDDFAFIKKPGEDIGYFSSDREEGIDNVYSFQFNYPLFVDCGENYDPSLCYIIEESNMTEIDTLPFKYIWDLGDGTHIEGFTVDHCYAEPGTYNISLSVIDSITGVTFAEVNDMELLIELPNQPYISSSDTLIMGDEYLFSSKESVMTWHEIDEWYWEMGDGTKLKGEEVKHSFTQPGVYYITVGALSELDSVGVQHKVCTYKEVLVLQDEEQLEEILAQQEADRLAIQEAEELAQLEAEEQARIEAELQEQLAAEELAQQKADELAQIAENERLEREAEELAIQESLELERQEQEGVAENTASEPTDETAIEEPEQTNETSTSDYTHIDYTHLSKDKVKADSLKQAITEEIIESTYFIELLENDEPISMDDPYFQGIRHEITERFREDDSLFVYSVGQAEDIYALWDIYQEVLDSGYISAIVKQERLKNFKEDTENIAFSNPKEEQEEWNRTITNFANIQFESNSSRINEVSMASLDYIALMMSIEEEFRLKIEAYSDNKGNADYNLTLSKRRADAVKRYLIRKGVDSSRLNSDGYGEANPISDNETEQGRAINRRVEFKILSSMF